MLAGGLAPAEFLIIFNVLATVSGPQSDTGTVLPVTAAAAAANLAAIRDVIRTGGEKYACAARMTPQDIQRRIQSETRPLFRRYSPADNCTSSAHLLLRSKPRGLPTPLPNNKGTAMSHRFTIDALKELITARRDAEQGLLICAERVRDSRRRELVLSYLHDCVQALQELQSLVRLLGGDPELPARNSAAGHRRWVDLRAALACDEDGVILDECERGASRALEVYRNALDDPLPSLVRAIVLRQFEDVMTNHDQIRDLRSQPALRSDLGASSGAQAGQH
jgi:uncharacterized protein (TIGR02284 family)